MKGIVVMLSIVFIQSIPGLCLGFDSGTGQLVSNRLHLRPVAALSTSDHGVFVVGIDESGSSLTLGSLDSDGSPQWGAEFTAPELAGTLSPDGLSIVEMEQGNFLISATIQALDAAGPGSAVLLMIISSSGTVLDSHLVSSRQSLQSNNAVQFGDGVAILCSRQESQSGTWQPIVVIVGADGAVEGQYELDLEKDIESAVIIGTAYDTLMIAGSYRVQDRQAGSLWLVEILPDGSPIFCSRARIDGQYAAEFDSISLYSGHATDTSVVLSGSIRETRGQGTRGILVQIDGNRAPTAPLDWVPVGTGTVFNGGGRYSEIVAVQERAGGDLRCLGKTFSQLGTSSEFTGVELYHLKKGAPLHERVQFTMNSQDVDELVITTSTSGDIIIAGQYGRAPGYATMVLPSGSSGAIRGRCGLPPEIEQSASDLVSVFGSSCDVNIGSSSLLTAKLTILSRKIQLEGHDLCPVISSKGPSPLSSAHIRTEEHSVSTDGNDYVRGSEETGVWNTTRSPCQPPGDSQGLQLDSSGTTKLTWNPPLVTTDPLLYDTIRSTDPQFTTAVCLEIDDVDLEATDSSIPSAGTCFFYLILTHNSCGLNAGVDFAGTPRSIFCTKPYALFEVIPDPADCQEGIYFDGSLSFHGNPARSIVQFEWDLDGDDIYEASGMAVGVGFSQLGDHDVKLRVTDDDTPPVSVITSHVVTVANRPPVAVSDGNKISKLSGPGVSFDGSASFEPDTACGDSIVSYEWVIGDGTFTLTGPTPFMTGTDVDLLGNGTHAVRLTVTDSLGLTGEITQSLVVGTSYRFVDFQSGGGRTFAATRATSPCIIGGVPPSTTWGGSPSKIICGGFINPVLMSADKP